MQNFLHMLVKTRRISLILNIRDQFEVLFHEFLGKLKGTLLTAYALEPQIQEDIQAALSRDLGKKVFLMTSVDPEILGGFVVRIGHRVLDLSLKSKIKALTTPITP